ncbi:MAG: histidine kinase dimerization/phosphoacceptor domain -containing protein, partial [Pacificimonas sp.]
DEVLSEIQHRVKNHLSMVVGMIRMQARQIDSAQTSFESLARRVEALQLLYNEMSQAGVTSATSDDIPLGAYLTRIASAIGHIDRRQGIRINVDADEVSVPVETGARIGLIFSEMLTNSLQHAFEERDHGLVEARSKALSGGYLRISIMDDGNGMPDDCKWPDEGNLGARIVRTLVQGLKGKLSVERAVRGTIFNLDVPLNEQATIIEEEREPA